MVFDEIKTIILSIKPVFVPITKTSDLFYDLGYDSLSFVRLILEIEDAFCISFKLEEFLMFQKIDGLIGLIETKLKEN